MSWKCGHRGCNPARMYRLKARGSPELIVQNGGAADPGGLGLPANEEFRDEAHPATHDQGRVTDEGSAGFRNPHRPRREFVPQIRGGSPAGDIGADRPYSMA